MITPAGRKKQYPAILNAFSTQHEQTPPSPFDKHMSIKAELTHTMALENEVQVMPEPQDDYVEQRMFFALPGTLTS